MCRHGVEGQTMGMRSAGVVGVCILACDSPSDGDGSRWHQHLLQGQLLLQQAVCLCACPGLQGLWVVLHQPREPAKGTWHL